MRLKFIPIILVTVILSSCTEAQRYYSKEYNGLTIESLGKPHMWGSEKLLIDDKPERRRMSIRQKTSRSFRDALVNGATFGFYSPSPGKEYYKGAALDYLRTTGRPGYKITRCYLIMKPHWEVRYEPFE